MSEYELRIEIAEKIIVFTIAVAFSFFSLVTFRAVSLEETRLLFSAYAGVVLLAMPVILYCLLIIGYREIATTGICLFYISCSWIAAIAWGVGSSIAALSFALSIFVALTLIKQQASVFAALGIITSFILLCMLQTRGFACGNGCAGPDVNWTGALTLTLSAIAFVGWNVKTALHNLLIEGRGLLDKLKDERKTLEKEIASRTEDLRKSQAQKIYNLYRFVELGKLCSGLVHDLISPVTAISLSLEQAEKEKSGSAQVSVKETTIKNIVNAAQSIKKIVLDTSKYLCAASQKEEINVLQSIRNTLSIFDYNLRQNDVRVSLDCHEQILIVGSEARFSQIFMNIISNSIDALESKMRMLSASRSLHVSEIKIRVMSKNEEVEIKTYDNGVGIHPYLLEKVFDPFFTTKNRGTGIGMYQIKEILEKDFGGNIFLESKINVGTVLTLKIPTPKSFRELSR